jgi:hypothetical protein
MRSPGLKSSPAARGKRQTVVRICKERATLPVPWFPGQLSSGTVIFCPYHPVRISTTGPDHFPSILSVNPPQPTPCPCPQVFHETHQ